MVAEVVRGGFVESIHHGLVAVTAPDGSVDWSLGDPETLILPRSSAKPVQALAMARAGARLTSEQWALACASHSGEPRHLDVVRSTLASAGLTEEALRNTPDLPLMDAQRHAWIADRQPPSSLAQNCSGKHAAMLAACVANGWQTEGYLDPAHPAQQAVRDTWAALGVGVAAKTTDGCGAPVHAIALADLARVFGRLAAAPDGPEAIIANAIRGHPELVGGTGRDVTELIAAIPGGIAKDGAEGVYALGLADGRGIAIKVVDGAARARPVVMGGVLERLGFGGPELWRRLAASPVLGHGKPVGSLRAALP